MLAAAAITVWSAVDYLVRALPALTREDRRREPRLPHRRQRPHRRRARRAAGRARRRGGRARALRRGRARRWRRAGRASSAATCSTRTRWPRAWRGCELVYHVAGDQHDVPDRSGGAVPRQRARRRDRGARRGAAPACRGSCSRRRPPRSARPPARSAARTRPHRGSYLSVYERSKHEGEAAAFAAARRAGRRARRPVNPSSVQGPGRAGGTGRILIAYLNGRLQAFVDTNISLVDIDDCVEAHVLAAERGRAGRALRDQRRDDRPRARRSRS